MTATLIISFCLILLIAYVFDLTSSKTKIPSVILLLALGWSIKQFTTLFSFQLPNFSSFLPIIGTIGLILIVLEGSLELELNQSKIGLLKLSFFGALIPIFVLAFLIALAFNFFGNYGIHESLINAIPFCVISSAIAIPSVRNLSKKHKEYVIYESSFSDIIGVLLFNFIAFNLTINASSFGIFVMQILIITIISVISTIGLSLLLNKIDHHIKFIPIILLVILIYEISKIFHLPALIFILFFGLTIGNIDELKRFKWIDKFQPDELKKEVTKFKELIIEAAFLIRASFFLLFGYLIETMEVLNTKTLFWAVLIVFLIFVFRYVQLKLSRLSTNTLLFVAPRGLISILLFLSIDPTNKIDIVNNSLIIQVIILTSILMMIGLMSKKKMN